MKCKDCEEETIDEHRVCVLCKAPICWNCVTRVAITVHGLDGATWEEPLYLCRKHAKERLGYTIRKKYLKNMKMSDDRVIALTNMMDIIGVEYPKKGD